jgi:hypothetical protein
MCLRSQSARDALQSTLRKASTIGGGGKDFARAFERLDRDGNGYGVAAACSPLIARRHVAVARSLSRWHRMRGDPCSVLSLSEFQTALAPYVHGLSTEDLRRLTDHFDSNGMTRRAVNALVCAMTRAALCCYAGDGYISYREFLAMVDPTFSL